MQTNGIFNWCGSESYVSPRHSAIKIENIHNSLSGLQPDWFRDCAFYHIWIKGFCDSNGDGVGDLPGIVSRLDYIKERLGCDAIWLSPVFDCGGKGAAADSNMHGYDTVDYYSVNPLFGTDEQLDTLLSEAHKRNIKVIFDFVPNHTAVTHPWFVDSARGLNGKSDWYVWNNEPLDGWVPMGANPHTWFSPEKTADVLLNEPMYETQRKSLSALKSGVNCKRYYYGAFGPVMPDLNYRNAEVREEMKNVVRYWLNRGFDGIRVDAVRYLVEETGADGAFGADTIDTAETHRFFAELRRDVIDAYAQLGYPKCMVAEANMHGDRTLLESYFGTPEAPEFSMLFDFDFAAAVYQMATGFDSFAPAAGFMKETGRKRLPALSVKACFLSNHDNPADRPASVYAEPNRLKLATAISLLLPAVPFIYYGNEIALENASGYTGMHDIRFRNAFDFAEAERQCSVPDSLLALHRSLLALRREHPALRRGDLVPLYSPYRAITAYYVTFEKDAAVCVFNNGTEPLEALPLHPANGTVPNFRFACAYSSEPSVSRTLDVRQSENARPYAVLSGLPAAAFAVFVPITNC